MKEYNHVHFVGIGGIGMSGIARVLLQLGHTVSGSDLRSSRLVQSLQNMGAVFYLGHDGKNIEGADVVVVSSAVSEDNPEIAAAKSRGIPIKQRAEMLNYLMKARYGIAVAGTHGKTTTTSMIAMMLEKCGKNPTVIIGGELNDIGSNAKLGKDEYLVAEADESDASFTNLEPRIAVVTNIDTDVNLNVAPFSNLEYDHAKISEKVVLSFKQFIDKIPEDGKAVLCVDSAKIKKILPEIKKPYVTYGFSRGAHYSVTSVQLKDFQSFCKVKKKGRIIGTLHLNVPGKHNILNALAAIAVGFEVGLKYKDMKKALGDYIGVKRRFQLWGEYEDIMIVDDYAHNPSKVSAAIEGARTGWKKRVIAVFQPHRYTRTKFLLEEFKDSFHSADVLIVTDIYSAGEAPIKGVSAEDLARNIRRNGSGPEVKFIPRKEEVIEYLLSIIHPGDLVLTLGAGDIWTVAESLAGRLKPPVEELETQ